MSIKPRGRRFKSAKELYDKFIAISFESAFRKNHRLSQGSKNSENILTAISLRESQGAMSRGLGTAENFQTNFPTDRDLRRFLSKDRYLPVRKYYHPIETLTSPATQANKSHNKNFWVLDLNQTEEKKERRYYTTKNLTLLYFKLLVQVTAKLMKMLDSFRSIHWYMFFLGYSCRLKCSKTHECVNPAFFQFIKWQSAGGKCALRSNAPQPI